MTACLRSIFSAASATRYGSSRSSSVGRPVRMLQKPQERVQMLPRIMNVAVRLFQHSPMFGQRASSQTVWRFKSRMVSLISRYPSPSGTRALSHSGLPCAPLFPRCMGKYCVGTPSGGGATGRSSQRWRTSKVCAPFSKTLSEICLRATVLLSPLHFPPYTTAPGKERTVFPVADMGSVARPENGGQNTLRGSGSADTERATNERAAVSRGGDYRGNDRLHTRGPRRERHRDLHPHRRPEHEAPPLR